MAIESGNGFVPPSTGGGGGGGANLISTYVGYGNSSNQLTGNPNYTYDPLIGFIVQGNGGVNDGYLNIIFNSTKPSLEFRNVDSKLLVIDGDSGNYGLGDGLFGSSPIGYGTKFEIIDSNGLVKISSQNNDLARYIYDPASAHISVEFGDLLDFGNRTKFRLTDIDNTIDLIGYDSRMATFTDDGGSNKFGVGDIDGYYNGTGIYGQANLKKISITCSSVDYNSIDGGGNLNVDYTLINDTRNRTEPNADGTYALVETLPTFVSLSSTGDGVTSSFTFTIPSGKSISNFQANNAGTTMVVNSKITGTTLTITCMTPPALSAAVLFGGFYF